MFNDQAAPASVCVPVSVVPVCLCQSNVHRLHVLHIMS